MKMQLPRSHWLIRLYLWRYRFFRSPMRNWSDENLLRDLDLCRLIRHTIGFLGLLSVPTLGVLILLIYALGVNLWGTLKGIGTVVGLLVVIFLGALMLASVAMGVVRCFKRSDDSDTVLLTYLKAKKRRYCPIVTVIEEKE